MKKHTFMGLLMLVIAASPLVYLAIVWNILPQKVPLHFDINMKPDKIGDKSELLKVTGIVAFISVAVCLLFENIHLIDPKRRSKPSGTFLKLSYVIVVFMAAINFIIINAAKGNAEPLNLLFPLLGLLFVFLGNYFNSIKPNYFAGYRLPWTLSSDENWRRTHRLAGKLWFWGGLLFVAASLLFNSQVLFPALICMGVVFILIPSIFSYRYFKSHMGQ